MRICPHLHPLTEGPDALHDLLTAGYTLLVRGRGTVSVSGFPANGVVQVRFGRGDGSQVLHVPKRRWRLWAGLSSPFRINTFASVSRPSNTLCFTWGATLFSMVYVTSPILPGLHSHRNKVHKWLILRAMWVVSANNRRGYYPPDFLNSIKNKDLCDQVRNLAEPLWGLLWVLVVVLAAFLAC
jgi:hypothetical protein